MRGEAKTKTTRLPLKLKPKPKANLNLSLGLRLNLNLVFPLALFDWFLNWPKKPFSIVIAAAFRRINEAE